MSLTKNNPHFDLSPDGFRSILIAFESCFARKAQPPLTHPSPQQQERPCSRHTKQVYLEETQRAVQLMVEEDISSIYQMPEINPDIRHSALFLTSKAAHKT